MDRFARILTIAFSISLLFPIFWASDLRAFSATETKIFHQGPFAFKVEITVKGDGSLKKQNPLPITSIKIKMKNERASSEPLKVKTIRFYQAERVFRDIDTRAFAVSPGQWVTKFFRLRKETQPFLGEKGYLEIAFENFAIQFHPRERKFSGPG